MKILIALNILALMFLTCTTFYCIFIEHQYLLGALGAFVLLFQIAFWVGMYKIK